MSASEEERQAAKAAKRSLLLAQQKLLEREPVIESQEEQQTQKIVDDDEENRSQANSILKDLETASNDPMFADMQAEIQKLQSLAKSLRSAQQQQSDSQEASHASVNHSVPVPTSASNDDDAPKFDDE